MKVPEQDPEARFCPDTRGGRLCPERTALSRDQRRTTLSRSSLIQQGQSPYWFQLEFNIKSKYINIKSSLCFFPSVPNLTFVTKCIIPKFNFSEG